MKRFAIAAVAFLSAASLGAAELNGLSAADVKASKIEAPSPVLERVAAEKCGHVSGDLTKMNLFATASRSQLISHSKTEAEFQEFIAMWRPILEKHGMRVVSTEYKHELGILKYESPDGRVVRMFLGDDMNYDALSADAMKKEQHMLIEALEKRGLTPVAAFMINNEIFRPTFNVYYLTKDEENQDHEVRLRQLKNGDDIDFDLLTNSVTLVEKDASFSMVYIGRLLGLKGKLAADEAGIEAKVADYKKFLLEHKKEFIAAKVTKLDEPFVVGEHTYRYYAALYFFQ